MEDGRLSIGHPSPEVEKEGNKTVHVSNISEPFFSAPGLCLDPLWEVGSDLISAFQMWKLRFRMLD